MAEQQFKRNIAYKLRIGDLLIGKPIMNTFNGSERFSFIELGNKKVVRVNVIGNIVDKYEARSESGSDSETENQRKYVFLTIDDGSGQIKVKAFGDDSDKIKDFLQGQTIIVIGTLRNWNNETYIAPEVVKEADQRYLLLRKLETEKDVSISQQDQGINREQSIAIKDRILDLIKAAEDQGGVDTEKINSELNSFSPGIINQELQRLLEEGIIFEPRPGKLRYLG